MPRPSRRPVICDAAIELAATGGNHAVTHQGIDRHLDLPRGSTSYYFRTREALIVAAVDRLVERSRDSFESRLAGDRMQPDRLIADYLDELLTQRRSDVLARLALMQDPAVDADARGALARCLFSSPAAEGLMVALSAPDATRAAADLITVLEGIVAVHIYGLRHSVTAVRGDLAESFQPMVQRALDVSSVRPPATTEPEVPAST